MARSTISNPNGNATGMDTGATLAIDAQYGIIAFDGGFQSCLNLRTPPPGGPCKYAHTIDDIEAQARAIKAINPNTRVFSYRNMQLGLSRNQHDCSKMYDPAYAGYWVQNTTSGKPLNDVHSLDGLATKGGVCYGFAPQSAYSHMDQFFLDWRNASAREWWLDVKLGSLLNSSLIDGFFWDDPAFGNEHQAIKDNLTPAEVADVSQHMQTTRIEGVNRVMAAAKWCIGSTCYTPLPLPVACLPSPQCAFSNHRSNNCVCESSAAAMLQHLQDAAASWRKERATFMMIPYTAESEDDSTACATGPAAVGVTGAPANSTYGSIQLSCLPGTGTMTVDFASFGLPVVGMRSVASNAFSKQSDCSAFARNASCDAGEAVLVRAKQLCDGKQSCRLNMHDPALSPPRSGCTDVPLRLAVRASGCTQGTAGGAHANFRESLAAFLLTRGDHAWMGHGFIGDNKPVWFPEWSVAYGIPLGPMQIQQVNGSDGGATMATRRWSKFDISLNLNTYEATFDPRAEQSP
jgi:hypothetical protein